MNATFKIYLRSNQTNVDGTIVLF